MIYQPLLALSRDEIHLWLTGDQVEPETAAACRLLLSADERQRQLRFYFERDRARYLLTRALVRMVLSRYEPVDPGDWVFSANAYGRPEIDVAKTGATDLCFNVSHTVGLIALAVTRGRRLGVDVENLDTRKSPLDVAKQVFTPMELAALGELPLERQHDRFFEYWTFKESYIKARGMGVSLPLQKFSVRLERDGLVALEIAPELSDDPKRWQLCQMRPAREYVLAICAERIGQGSPVIAVRRTTLFDREDEIQTFFSVQFDRVSV